MIFEANIPQDLKKIYYNNDIKKVVINFEDMSGDDLSFFDKYNIDILKCNLDIWDVSNVRNMRKMFFNIAFRQPLNRWDVSNVEDMSSMFENTTYFNQPLDFWDVSNVRNMNSMFKEALPFNQPLGTWDVSNVEDMGSMFENTTYFNQPLDFWDVSNVRNMNSMFKEALAFNQSLKKWKLNTVMNNLVFGRKHVSLDFYELDRGGVYIFKKDSINGLNFNLNNEFAKFLGFEFYKEFKKWISLTEPSVFDIDLFFEGNRVVMILILSMRLYDIAIVSYDDREIAKREGFIWNPDEKTWIRNKYPLEYFENSDETFNSI